MKKILSIVLLVLCMALISGCMRFNTTIDIKSNGKADLSMLYAVQKTEGEDSGSSEDYDSQKKEMEKAGWSVEDYNEDGYVGLKCTMKNVDIKDVAEEVGTSNASVGNEESPIKLTKDGLVYNFDWDYNSGSNDDSSSDDSSGENSADEMQQYADAIKNAGGYMTFTLKVPVKAKSSNATNVLDNGKTLEWDLLSLKQGEGIHAQFMLINIPLIIAIILAVILVIIVVVIIIVTQTSKKKNAAFPQGQQFGQPQQFGAQSGNFGAQPQQPTGDFGQQPQPQGDFGQQPQQAAPDFGQQVQQPQQAAPDFGQQPQQPAPDFGQQPQQQASEFVQDTPVQPQMSQQFQDTFEQPYLPEQPYATPVEQPYLTPDQNDNM